MKTLLPISDVSESYIDAYDQVRNAGGTAGSGIGFTSVREILSSSGLSATDQDKIFDLVVASDGDDANGLGRSEFNVLLALVGLAQEGDELTFDAVDDRRHSKLPCFQLWCVLVELILTSCSAELPMPNSSYLDQLRSKPDPPAPVQSQERPSTPPQSTPPAQEPRSARSRRSRQDSLGGLEADPWSSPDLHRGHNHPQAEPDAPVLNGYGSVRSGTNAWNKPGLESPQDGGTNGGRINGGDVTIPSSAESGWGGLANAPGRSEPGQSDLGAFGLPGEHGDSSTPRRSLGVGRSTNPRVEEMVTVTLLPEKEGMFMLKHRNYEIKSTRRGSTVIRRYSDFVWLLDCLQKRYPFRQLPLLPPKRLAGTSMDPKLHTSFTHFKKSMALTLQRIQILSSKNAVAGLYGSRMRLFVIRCSAKSSS